MEHLPRGKPRGKTDMLNLLLTQLIPAMIMKPLAQLLAWIVDGNPADFDTLEEIQANIIPAITRLPIKVLADILGLIPLVGQPIENALTDYLNQTRTTAEHAMVVANGKPSMEQIPIGSTLWMSINADEDSTFPRANLSNGAAASTSGGGSGGGSGSHTHSLGQIPDYQPAGNGSNFIEIGYIKAGRTRSYSQVGFITGDSATFAGIQNAYVGVYLVNTSTGALSLLNVSSATVDIKSSITTKNTEQRFNLGVTINATQGQVFAVAILQKTGAFQTCASLMMTKITNIDPPVTQFPRKNYCYADVGNSLPSSIAEADLNYGSSTKIPFYCLR